MPPRKEIHYFGRGDKYPTPSHLQKQSPFVRLFGRDKPSKKSRTVLAADIIHLLTGKNKISDIPWLMRYHFGWINDTWYLSLFRGKPGLIKGEITPNYCMMDQEDVEKIHQLLPDLKVIYSIRNPVERSWSHIRFGLGRRRIRLEEQSLDQIKIRLNTLSHKMASDYVGTVQRWQSVYPGAQMIIIFQEQIEREPEKLARELFHFLGVDDSFQAPAGLLKSRINASAEKAMPLEIRRMMVERYYPQVVELNKMIGGYTQEWLEEYKAYL
jgi:hypothetical protein